MTRRGVVGGSRWLAFFGILAVIPFAGAQHWVMNMLVFALIYAIMSVAWNLVGGFAGYPSLGHAAFFGVGAYAEAIWFQSHTIGSGYEPFLALPIIGIGVAAIGIPLGIISMRTRSDVFAIVTITLLFVAQTLAFNLRGLTNGAQGLAIGPAPFPAATFERPFYFVLLAMLCLTMLIASGTIRSKFGLSLAAVRADEDKARGVGVRVTVVKVAAFAVSVGIVGMVGGVWAYYEGFIYPQFAVDPLVSIGIVLMTFLGGRATLWGPVLGAVVVELAQQWLAYELGGQQFYLIGYALIFLIVIVFLPQGVVPTIQSTFRRRRLRRSGEPPLDHREAEPARPETPLMHQAQPNGVKGL